MVLELKTIIDEFQKLETRYKEIKSAFDYAPISNQLEILKTSTLKQDFWGNREEAQKILKKISSIENQLNNWGELDDRF